MRQNQSGYIGVLMAIAVAAGGLLLSQYARFDELRRVDSLTNESGRHLQQVVFGVQKLISEQGSATPVNTFTGINWLKNSANCGALPGAGSADYISNCAMQENNAFGETYTTTTSISGSVISARITTPWPRDRNWERNGALAARIRGAGNSYLSGSTPVAQTFAQYSLDTTNQLIVVEVTTAPSTDIWFRTDGSNEMGADANIGGNDIYNVQSLFGAATATEDVAATITVGSAMNVAGIITLGNGTTAGSSNSYLDIQSISNSGPTNGYSIISAGDISAAGADFASRITVGDGSTSASTEIEFVDGPAGSASNVVIRGDNGDLEVSNGSNDATVVADRIYTQGVNRFTDQAIYNVTLAKNGDGIPKPSCPSPFVPQVFTSFSGLAQNPARPISGFSVRALDIGSSWQIDVTAKTDGPGDVPDSILEADILVLVKCS